MSDNLANQEKSTKKSKKMEPSKASASKSTSSQDTIKSVERSTEAGDDEKKRERHNSGASSTHSQSVYSRNTWSNNQRYNKYRGSSESRRGHNHNYSNRDSFVSSSSFDSGNLCRHTSTQSLNSNASKKIEEEAVEVASSTTDSDVTNDIRRIAVNSPETKEGNVTYIAAGTAPAAKIGTLRQNANTAAFSAYAGPAPGWENQRGERGTKGGFTPAIAPPFKSARNMEESSRYYEKREDGVRREGRPTSDPSRQMNRRGSGIMKRTGERTHIGEIESSIERDTSTLFFQQQNDENCRNSLVSLNALSQIQMQLAESQGMKGQTLPRIYGEWRRRGDERDGGRGGRARETEGDGGRGGRARETEGDGQLAVPNVATAAGENKDEEMYPVATSMVCGMDGRERRREENPSHYEYPKESSLPTTPNESDLIFTNASSTSGCVMLEGGSIDGGVNEMDRGAPISVKAFHNGVPVPPIHTEMRDMSCVSSSTSSSTSHHYRIPMESPHIPSGGGILTSIPPTLPTTVSTSTPPPTVSSALPPTMVAHPQRSQDGFRSCSSSPHHLYPHHPPGLPSHLPSLPSLPSSVTSSSNSMLHSSQRHSNFVQPPPNNVMEQSEDGARMGGNGGISGPRKEETVSSSSRSPFHSSAAHPTVWSGGATVGSGGIIGESVGSLPPRAPPSGFIDEGGRFTISEMDYLSEEIWHYHNTMTQTESTLSRKLHLRDMLYYAICPVFPMCGLYVVGSSLNGFGNNSSDMDLCLMITNKDLDQKTDAVVVLNMILTQLQAVEWVSHQQLILAKVPILRIQFTAPFGDITVDLNANNSVAIKNTHLLCYYSTFDWRVRPLVTIVKEWAKKKGINDANRSSFTSYSLVLMVIHYLQCGVDQPVLPSLQSMYVRRFSRTADVRSLNVSIPLSNPPDDWTFNDTSTLGELLIGFLEYFALKFDYNQHAISVRMGKKLDRTAVVRMRGQYGNQTNSWRSQWRCVCIEEPFTYSNTAHSVYDEMVFMKIKDAFKDAYNELESTRDLHKLMHCTPISVPNLPHGNGAVVYMGGSCHADTSVVASSSSSSLSTPHSGHASSASSSCGEDEVGGEAEERRGGGMEKRDDPSPSPSPSPSPRPVKKDVHPSHPSHSTRSSQPERPEMPPVVSSNQ